MFVTLNDLYVEGLVHVSELGGEYFQYNETTHELRGERTGRRFRLTDELDVQVSRVDLEARRIDFRLVERTDFRTISRIRRREGAEDGTLRPDAASAVTPPLRGHRRAAAGKAARGRAQPSKAGSKATGKGARPPSPRATRSSARAPSARGPRARRRARGGGAGARRKRRR